MAIKQIYTDSNHAFQDAEFTCGPVTLLNIMRQKGDNARSEEELSKLCAAKAGIGTSNGNMIAASKKLGLEIVESKKDAELDELEKHVDNGAFVIVCYFHAFSGQGHYAQVAEYDGKAFYLRDCSLGFIRLKKQYFKSHWHNDDKTIYGWFLAVS